MKRKLVAVILSVVMITSLLTGCGGEKETPAAAPAPVAEAPAEDTETKAPEEDTTDTDTDTTDTDEAEVEMEMVSDETFAELSEAYDALTELYNMVATTYNDSVYDVPEVKEAMDEAYDLLEQMGEITQDTITEADAEALAQAMLDVAEGLQTLADALLEAQDVG